MDTLPDTLLKTLAYFDLCDYAPTLLDIERWLLKTDAHYSLAELQQALQTHPQIRHAEGLYFLRGRDGLVAARKHKYSLTEQKWKRTKRYVRLLAAMPYVEGVWLVNSMGWENAREQSDIDVLIVTTPGHIWSARFWTTTMMKLLRQRPHEQSQDRALCLSLYIASDSLNLKSYQLAESDIHYTFWVNQCSPLYDTGAYETFTRENSWLSETFAAVRWTEKTERRTINLSATEKCIKFALHLLCTERLLKKIQWRILPNALRSQANHDQRVVMNDHILKLHTNDTREQRQREWEQRITNLQHS